MCPAVIVDAKQHRQQGNRSHGKVPVGGFEQMAEGVYSFLHDDKGKRLPAGWQK
jgi:hypothetical protein